MVAAAVGAAAVVGGVASSAMSASAAGSAADAQQQSAQNSLQFSEQQYADQQKNISPYLAAGQQGVTAYGDLLGSNGADAQNQAIGDIKNGAQFQGLMQTGNQNILANASATGGLRGSNTSNTLANTSIGTLNGLITQRLAGYGQLMSNGLNAISGQQAANNAAQIGVTNANNQSANAQTALAGSLSNSFNSGIGSITQGINRYAQTSSANNPTYGTTDAGNPIYFTGT
jgi:hypothetical protein